MRKKLMVFLLAMAVVAFTVGCSNVPVTQAPEPNAPVVSNIALYEAPERSNAPEPVKVEGAIG